MEKKEGIEIFIASTVCRVWVPKQGSLEKVEYANTIGKNGRASVEIKLNVKEIATYSNETGLGCPTSGTKATYTGKSVAEGETGTVEVK